MSSLLLDPALDDLAPPEATSGVADALFAGPVVLIVQTPIDAHQTKKRSGSSDGAQTYDTPIT
ncbi:hypothetical protein DP939_19385 [Spongiactinospora rosea]|uniref:Uncharacterized protein n=1 Tax=Spongiactinospora rosea TaxID=2248750 RepID=A0A366LXF6_9ACTN|nr:hypothetical protein [Spongiactinospora rosea]RBQ18648.1 hypothetical protein DP939_19385 [Spongiactinospora rosea]